MGDLSPHDLLGQPELGDAVHQHPAQLVERFEHGDVVAQPRQVGRTGQPGGAAADDRHLLSGPHPCPLGLREPVEPFVIGHEPLERTDGDRLAFVDENACTLALGLLGAHPPADGRERVVFLDGLGGGIEVPVCDLLDEVGDPYAHRTSVDAAGSVAHETAARLQLGESGGEAEVHFREISPAGLDLPLRHELTIHRHTLPARQLGHRATPARHRASSSASFRRSNAR